MKVLFVIDCLTSGGKERRLVELMKGLKDKPSVEFQLVIMSNDIHYKEVFDLGIPVHQFVRKTKKDLSIFSKLFNLCKQFRPDYIHCWDSMTAIYSIPVAKILGIKLINAMVADTPNEAKQTIRNKYWLRGQLTFPFSSLVIGNSQAGLRAYRAPSRKSHCVHNGYSFDRTLSLRLPESVRQELNIDTPYVIGMVAAFAPRKDYKSYFLAAQEVLRNRKDVTFIAIGGDTDSDAAKAFIDEKYMPHFRLLGKRSGIESYINIMDIGVLTNFREEGISNSILEYMAMKKPVLSTSGGGTNEIVLEAETGFLVEPSDVPALAAKMEMMLDDANLRQRLGEAGRTRVENEFTIARMIERYVDIYEKFLKKGRTIDSKPTNQQKFA